MTVTFCGHSDVANTDAVRAWLYETVEKLIEVYADLFLLGGYGAFDRMAAGVVAELRKKYPQIQSVLVKPYLDREMDERGYDWTVYPGLEMYPGGLQSPIATDTWWTKRISLWPMSPIAGAVQHRRWNTPIRKRKVLYYINKYRICCCPMGGSFLLFYVKMYGILSGFVIYFKLLEYVLTNP